MIYSNTASVGQLRAETHAAVMEFINSYKENNFYISGYKKGWEKVEQCRSKISELLQNKLNSVLLYTSTTDAMSILLTQLRLKEGSVVAIPKEYFPSIGGIKLSFEQMKYKVVEIGNDKGEIKVEDIQDLKIDVLLIEWVNYWNGYKNNLKDLSHWCRKNNVIFAVDAVQGVGSCAIDFDIHDIDFFISAGHKWLRALEGAAFAVVSERMNSLLKQTIFGYNSFSDRNQYDCKNRHINHSLLRFELGTLSGVSFISLHSAISELLNENYNNVVTKLKQNSFAITQHLLSYGAIVHSPIVEEKCTGIVSFTLANIDTLEIYNKLLEFGVIAKIRNERIRLSPDATVNLENLLQRLNACLKGIL
ncbi:aminotransferase class V-fold PLP-dependent enzyme [Fluviispira sanaruensis]|uniref:Aminotransferase class V-fold PLP-dependent enzyme n=1 Tax=Fluviispira sanaruensis TaxID=2493639 RepID=A0A4P2VPU0_FLUSA|nr:aminotransferase class V-fold PLP-dependent enzyme [Fluviispira sanaruensis]BBH54244.1 aminotransferase class V-fold PLP-dependent enzyme [Fluviispira sanaruensis]